MYWPFLLQPLNNHRKAVVGKDMVISSHPAYCSKQSSFQNHVLQQRGVHLQPLDYRLKWGRKKVWHESSLPVEPPEHTEVESLPVREYLQVLCMATTKCHK